MPRFDEPGDPRSIQPDQMYLSVSGVLEGGECEDESSLRIEYSIKYPKEDQDWTYIKKTVAIYYNNMIERGRRTLWNFVVVDIA
jgi:hypothetical protein